MEHVDISGIKCDNIKCDYADASVKFEEYFNWLNKPCPKCGDNLLTQEDYDFCLNLDNMVENLVNLLPEGFNKQLDEIMAAKGISQDDLNKVFGQFKNEEIAEALKETSAMIKNISEDDLDEIGNIASEIVKQEIGEISKRKKTRRSK